MNQHRERYATMAWLEGSLKPDVAHSLTFLRNRPFGRGQIRWDVFACLYPDRPKYRLYSRESLSSVQRNMVRAEVAGIQLPRGVSRDYNLERAKSGVSLMASVSRERALPLGLYVTGFYQAAGTHGGGQPVAAIWHASVLPLAYVVEALKRAAAA